MIHRYLDLSVTVLSSYEYTAASLSTDSILIWLGERRRPTVAWRKKMAENDFTTLCVRILCSHYSINYIFI